MKDKLGTYVARWSFVFRYFVILCYSITFFVFSHRRFLLFLSLSISSLPFLRGSFATMKRATRKSDGKQFAIKVIKKTKLNAEELSVVHDEVEIMHKVSSSSSDELIVSACCS